MPRKAGRVELGRAHGGDRPVSALAGGHHHQCGPQRAVGNGVALLQQLQHGVGGLIGRHRRNRLVQVRIELVALGRRDFLSRLRSKAAASCFRVTSTPSRRVSTVCSGWASAASRLSLTGTRLSANDSMPNLRALDTSSWARRRTFSASARTRSSWSCCSLTVAWAASSWARSSFSSASRSSWAAGPRRRRRRARASGLRARGVPSWGVLQKNGFRRHEWGQYPISSPG